LGEKEYIDRKAEIDLFISARRGGQKADQEITRRGNALIKDILPNKDLLGDVWEILYGRSPNDVKEDIMLIGLARVLREIATYVASKYIREWDNGIGAVYGVSKNSRIRDIDDTSTHEYGV